MLTTGTVGIQDILDESKTWPVVSFPIRQQDTIHELLIDCQLSKLFLGGISEYVSIP